MWFLMEYDILYKKLQKHKAQLSTVGATTLKILIVVCYLAIFGVILF